MTKIPVTIALILSIVFLPGCTIKTSKMATVPTSNVNINPESGNAVIVFMRSAAVRGGHYQASVFDITDGSPTLVGILSASTRLAHQSPPGERRFMVISETADFMDADLLEGKVYYVEVDPRAGWLKERFSLIPYRGRDVRDPDFGDICDNCDWFTNTAESHTWAQDNMASIRSKMAGTLPDWLESSDKQKLLTGDHR